jgi:GT2 family glycosyltransferase
VIFSVIIPTFNSEGYIGPCLAALLQSDFPRDEYEIIVVDGGSSDRTREIALQHPGVKVVPSSNVSISNSRNLGAKNADGDHLLFIDSDCLVDPQLLAVAHRALQTHACFGAFYKPAPEHGWISRVWLDIERKPAGLVEWITAGTLAVRKDAFFEIGGFNESLMTGEDVDLGFRLRQRGHRILHDPAVGSIHLGQPDRLALFFKKEKWRGRSLLPSVRSQGWLTRPSRFSLCVLAFGASIAALPVAAIAGAPTVAAALAAIVVGGPTLLGLRSSLRNGSVASLLPMTALWFVFLLARATAVVAYNQFYTPPLAPRTGGDGPGRSSATS